jgi:hypothetical protein
MCSVCQQVDDGSEDRELRPYGKLGALICYDCMKSSPEREAEAGRQIAARFEVASEESNVIILGDRDGPVPL